MGQKVLYLASFSTPVAQLTRYDFDMEKHIRNRKHSSGGNDD